MKKALIPLVVFAVLAVFLAIGLTRNPREVPSPLIGKPVPAFTAPVLHSPDKSFSNKDMLGQVWLLNVWASWCVSCMAEHPVLMAFAKTKALPIIGLGYKDQPADGIQWLKRNGDPYQLTAVDLNGRIGIDFGVYGVPETYLIDKAGIIRHKVIGPVTQESINEEILPKLRELQR